MDTRTYDIVQFDNEAKLADAVSAGTHVEVPDGELDAVRRMNRHQRRAWAAQQRSAQRAAVKGRA